MRLCRQRCCISFGDACCNGNKGICIWYVAAVLVHAHTFVCAAAADMIVGMSVGSVNTQSSRC